MPTWQLVPDRAGPIMFAADRAFRSFTKPFLKAEVHIEFEDGTNRVEGFVAHSPLTRTQRPLAEQLGVTLAPMDDSNAYAPYCQTSVRGFFFGCERLRLVMKCYAMLLLGLRSLQLRKSARTSRCYGYTFH